MHNLAMLDNSLARAQRSENSPRLCCDVSERSFLDFFRVLSGNGDQLFSNLHQYLPKMCFLAVSLLVTAKPGPRVMHVAHMVVVVVVLMMLVLGVMVLWFCGPLKPWRLVLGVN